MTKKFRQFFNFSKQGKVWYFKACTIVGAYKTGLGFFQVPLTIFHIGATFWEEAIKLLNVAARGKTLCISEWLHPHMQMC